MAQQAGPRFVLLAILWLSAVSIGGCGGKPYQVADVDGVVLIHGQPAPKIQIQFIPDIDKGSVGPRSTADTDEQGRFTLQLEASGSAPGTPGAVVGWHRVVLLDLQRGESARGAGVPIRFSTDLYGTANSTPLREEVKAQEGPQTLEIKIP